MENRKRKGRRRGAQFERAKNQNGRSGRDFRKPSSLADVQPRAHKPGRASSKQNSSRTRAGASKVSPACQKYISELTDEALPVPQALAGLASPPGDLSAPEISAANFAVGEALKKRGFEADAQVCFERAIEADPNASPKAWAELARTLQDRGEAGRARAVLLQALEHVPAHDPVYLTIATRAVRMIPQRDVAQVRLLMKHIQDIPVSKCWRVVAAAAKAEAEAGNFNQARAAFEYICGNLRTPGPALAEWTKVEMNEISPLSAFQIATLGTFCTPSYGPIWFSVLVLSMYLFPGATGLPVVLRFVDKALEEASEEVKWKLAMVGVVAAEVAGERARASPYAAEALLKAPGSMRWRVFYYLAHIEVARLSALGRAPPAPPGAPIPESLATLIAATRASAGPKPQPSISLLASRVHEFYGQPARSLEILDAAMRANPDDWKLFFEKVLVLRRSGRAAEALAEAKRALDVHPRAGRIWAAYVSLHQPFGDSAHAEAARLALKSCPKSGEVWCEMARLRLNPLSSRFSRRAAHKAIEHAIAFTPQYGDTFVEAARLAVLEEGVDSDSLAEIMRKCTTAQPNYGRAWAYCRLPQQGAGFGRVKDGPPSPKRGTMQVACALILESVQQTARVYAAAQRRRGDIYRKSMDGTIPSGITTDRLTEMGLVIPPATTSLAGRFLASHFRGFAFNTAVSRLDLVQPMCQERDAGGWVLPQCERLRLIFPNLNLQMFGL
eukprot:gnl/Chilomastix_cuspidata/3307.p1 GENE.gnl/Chilomastix_cuspidata/3307~~gnl/Chilomastix_cuspidata/3307.p1  ORF type:complete len:727 (-),score=362.40 gnl/Chilomastix_cuspidata/3307:264-2444(-)